MGSRPQVRCRRCSRGACVECFPEPKTGWMFLCSICDKDVMMEKSIPESMLRAKRKKVAEQQFSTQNTFDVLSNHEEEDHEEEEEEEDELEEAARKREEKKKNEEGGKKEEKEICKSFKFGGKCPHGMNGIRKHKQGDRCNKYHPKVCNKLLTHGVKGCNGKECDRFHPKMCYSSMNSKICSKEKCTFWHCKGTSFAPESNYRYEAPSRSSLHQYPALPARHSRSPDRREQEMSRRPREEGPGRREREERRHMEEDNDRRDREERTRRREWEERRFLEGDQERRSRGGRREEERSREGKNQQDSNNFLDLAQMIRQEVQRAFLSLLPPAGASGSATGLPRMPAATPTPSWAELLGRVSSN